MKFEKEQFNSLSYHQIKYSLHLLLKVYFVRFFSFVILMLYPYYWLSFATMK